MHCNTVKKNHTYKQTAETTKLNAYNTVLVNLTYKQKTKILLITTQAIKLYAYSPVQKIPSINTAATAKLSMRTKVKTNFYVY